MKKCVAKTIVLSLLVVGWSTGFSEAKIWRVARDGSGDFTTIPDAMSAVSEGDTVLIGPGRYTEYVDFVFAGTTSTDVYVPVSVDDLTLIGSGQEVTIVGPEVREIVGEGPKGITVPLGLSRFSARGLTIENLKHGAFMSGRSDLFDLEIRNCRIGAWLFTTNAVVDSCAFYDNDRGVNTGDGCADLRVENCHFIDNNSLGVGVNRTLNVTIEGCSFENDEWTTTGIQYSENCTGLVRECRFNGCQGGIAIRSESDVTVERNAFIGNEVALNVFDGSIARGTRNIFRGSFASLVVRTASTTFLSNNHILKSKGWAVYCDGFIVQPVDIDLRNNYWGTDSTDSISAWIFDGNDPQDPPWEENLSNVLFEPFSPVPVESSETSSGRFKSLFRR